MAERINPALEALRDQVTGRVERGEAEAITEQRAMPVEEARALLRAGRRLRIVIGPAADDPTVVLSLRDGMVMCESVAGWSAGVVEPACCIESDYLGTYLDHESIEVLSGGESGWRPWES